MIINIEKKIKCAKACKSLFFNNKIYQFYITHTQINDSMTKFVLNLRILDTNFNILKENIIDYDIDGNNLIWDIEIKEMVCIILLENKSIDIKNHTNEYYYLYINLNAIENLENFILEKTEKLWIKNYIVPKIIDNTYFSSKIEIDQDRPDYYWGKYLFSFFINDNELTPRFDNIVDYKVDKGHVFHWIHKIQDNEYIMLFSIRNALQNYKTKYKYRLCSAKTRNFIDFYDTKDVIINNNFIDKPEWYCYPNVIKMRDKFYVFLNQDDFGKEKELCIGELII